MHHAPDTRVEVSPHLAATLGVPHSMGRARWGPLIDALIEALGLDDSIGWTARCVVGDLVPMLSDALDHVNADWVGEKGAYEHRTMAALAVEDMPTDEIVDVLTEFGWADFGQPLMIRRADEVNWKLRDRLADRLSQRVLTALYRWRKAGSWDAEHRAGVEERAVRNGFTPTPADIPPGGRNRLRITRSKVPLDPTG